MENKTNNENKNGVSNLELSTRVVVDILIKLSSITKLTSMLMDTLYLNENEFKSDADFMILEPAEQKAIVDSIVKAHEQLNLGLQKALQKIAQIKQGGNIE